MSSRFLTWVEIWVSVHDPEEHIEILQSLAETFILVQHVLEVDLVRDD